jgi:hypothetical protein
MLFRRNAAPKNRQIFPFSSPCAIKRRSNAYALHIFQDMLRECLSNSFLYHCVPSSICSLTRFARSNRASSSLSESNDRFRRVWWSSDTTAFAFCFRFRIFSSRSIVVWRCPADIKDFDGTLRGIEEKLDR